MARTNIDLDEQLVGAVMRRHDLRTARDAAGLALRLPVLHRDRDFDVIARHTPLQVVTA
jgi:Arc/MetJ family transcription regulator